MKRKEKSSAIKNF